MPNTPYNRQTFKFMPGGLQVSRPVNLIDAKKYPFLSNVTSVIDGTLQSRYGYTALFQTGVSAPIHSMRRVNNIADAPTSYARFIGVDTGLFYGQTTLTLLDSGFSGNPLSLITYRPIQSPETWLYVGDSSQQRKYNLEGANYLMGIKPPIAAPIIELEQALYKEVDPLNSASGWTAAGLGGSITAVNRVPASTTIAEFRFDYAAPDWATIVPTNSSGDYSWLGVGGEYTIDSETIYAEQVFVALPTTNVVAITYDTGGAAGVGFCTIQFNTPTPGLQRNQLIELDTGTGDAEWARIISVTDGPDGLSTIRSFTANNHIAGPTHNALIPLSFYAYCQSSHSPGATISGSGLAFTATVSSDAGEATISKTGLSLDLTQVDERPLGPSDYLHFSMQADNLQNITEGRLYLDIDSQTTDFAHNARYISFRPSDFLGSGTGNLSTISVRQTAVQNQQIDDTPIAFTGPTSTPTDSSAYIANPTQGTQPLNVQVNTPISYQSGIGTDAWTEFFVPIASLFQIGTDLTVSLGKVKGLQLYLNVTDTVTVAFSSWWVGGGFGPDIIPSPIGIGTQGQPYLYRFRYRSSQTGAVSVPSQTNFSGVLPRRTPVKVQPFVSADPQVDKIDIERLGGVATDSFHYVGTIPNDGSAYIDILDDGSIKGNDVFPEDTYVPFAVDDLPRTGTCQVIGTHVQRFTGDGFNVNWPNGTEIILNNYPCRLNGPPGDSDNLTIVAPIPGGFVPTGTFYLPAPTITASPMPVLFGPFHNRLFALGSPNNPGIVFYTRPDNPDGSSDYDYVEVCDPSRPLMSGVVYEGSLIVFNTEEAYRLEPSYTSQTESYTPVPLTTGRGLFSRWGIAVGPKIWFIARDGIYEYAADGAALSITDADLYPLFPHDSQPGQSQTFGSFTVIAPDFSFPNNLRLAFNNNWLNFDYRGLDGRFYTLSYHVIAQRWFYNSFTPNASSHYTEEGPNINSTLIGFIDGTVGVLGGYLDNTVPVPCVIATGSQDLDDTRATKQFGDLTVDSFEASGESLAFQIALDDYSTFLSPTPSAITSAGRTYDIFDISEGSGTLHRNIGLIASWSQTNAASPTTLYEWQPAWFTKPEFSVLRATDWFDLPSNSFVQGVRITCDTQNVSRQVLIQRDNDISTGITLTIQANGETTLPFSFTPFEAHNLRLLPLDTTGQWRIMNVEWVYEPAPETASTWSTQWTSHGLEGWQHIREFYLMYRTTSFATFTVTTEFGSYSITLPPLATAGRGYFVPISLKGKAFQYAFAGASDLQIYELDCEVRLKPWGSESGYQSVRPFGDLSRTNGGARI